MSDRVILHLDMDAFFAAIEQREDPTLVGKPVIIGHRGSRGVVATCSYEARPYGIHSAMPAVTAERLCPDATWLPGRGRLYREVSQQVFGILEEHVPRIEQVSVDEAYGDLTGLAPSVVAARSLAQAVKERIRDEQSLTASIGLAPCRFMAKIASDLDKPDGLTLLPREAVEERLHPLPVRRVPGVGPKLEARLARLGIRTIGQIARSSPSLLRASLGLRTALFLERRARGEDDTPIETAHERRQVSEERTYVEDIVGEERIHRELLARAEGVARTLRRKRLRARTITIKARDGSYNTVSRSQTLDEPTDLAEEILAAALALWHERIRFEGRGIRLLGIGASHLLSDHEISLPLFPDEDRERSRAAARAADAVRKRFGSAAIRPGRLVDPPKTSGVED